MEKITSFTIDHNKLKPGVYVSRKDQVEGGMAVSYTHLTLPTILLV